MTSRSVERLWRAARKLNGAARSGKPLPPLLFFTDPARAPDLLAVVRGLPRGSAVVFRAFGAPGATRIGLALRRETSRRGVFLLVGADARLATLLKADGIHLPQRMAGKPGTVRQLRGRFLVTAAAHDAPAIRRARASRVHAVVLSPVFPSASPSAGRPMGQLRFSRLARQAGIPVYALGGVNAGTASLLAASRAVGIAAVSGFAETGART